MRRKTSNVTSLYKYISFQEGLEDDGTILYNAPSV